MMPYQCGQLRVMPDGVIGKSGHRNIGASGEKSKFVHRGDTEKIGASGHRDIGKSMVAIGIPRLWLEISEKAPLGI